MSVSFWQKDQQGATVTCDIAIVGGGIVGVSAAYWLKRKNPGCSAVLLEAERLGYGASGRNAGFILQGASSDYASDCNRLGPARAAWLWNFTLENRNLLESELDPGRFGFSPSGSLLLAGSPEEQRRLQESEALLRAEGQSATYLTASNIEDRIRAKGFYGGLFIPTGATVHSTKLVTHVAGHSGAQVLEHHRVERIESHPDHVWLHTPVRTVKAKKVLLALNAYLPRLIPDLSAIVAPMRAQMLATHPLDAHVLDEPVYSHDGFYYMRQTEGGNILIGGARHLYEQEETGFQDITTPHLQQALLQYLKNHFPWTNGATVARQWSGVMGFAPDHLPLVGTLPEEDRVLWAAGFTGHGMGYGFRFGSMLAQWLINGPEIDEKAFFGVDRLKQSTSR